MGCLHGFAPALGRMMCGNGAKGASAETPRRKFPNRLCRSSGAQGALDDSTVRLWQKTTAERGHQCSRSLPPWSVLSSLGLGCFFSSSLGLGSPARGLALATVVGACADSRFSACEA